MGHDVRPIREAFSGRSRSFKMGIVLHGESIKCKYLSMNDMARPFPLGAVLLTMLLREQNENGPECKYGAVGVAA